VAIEFTEHLDDGLFKLVHVAEEVVVEGAPLEVSPKAGARTCRLRVPPLTSSAIGAATQ